MKRFVPPTTLKFDLQPGSGKTGELLHVPVKDVHVFAGLNLRVEGTPEFEEGIALLAASIQANGYYEDKPLAGFVAEDGQVIVIDGHRRLAAVTKLNEESLDGDVVTVLPVIVRPESDSMADLTIAMIQSSTGEQLTMFEKGIGVRRLMADGMVKSEVAKRLGVTEKTVDNYLLVAQAPAKVRDLLLDDKVTSTAVLKAMRKPETAVAKLSASVKTAAEKGRTRARPSDEAPVKPKPAPAAPAPTADPAASTGADKTFNVPADSDMGATMKQVAQWLRSVIAYNPDDLSTADVTISIVVAAAAPVVEAKPKRTRKPKEEPVPEELAHALTPDEL